MNAKTLKALRGSIEKWDKIVKGTGKDEGGENCPLCQLYGYDCSGCPVDLKIGGCYLSPFDGWEVHQEDEHFDEEDMKIHCPTCKTLAIKELNFLKSLLPKRRKR